MSERISPQDEAAVRKFAEAGSSITYETAERAWAAMPKVLAELDVLRGEVERRDELLAGFVNVLEACSLTASDEEDVEPLLELAWRVIGDEPNE